MKSNESFMITNNNFFGENHQELFIEQIILDPFFIPFLINNSQGIIQKNSIQWTSNYWDNHDTLSSKQIPGKMFIYLKFPNLAIRFTIYQKDFSPANTPFAI